MALTLPPMILVSLLFAAGEFPVADDVGILRYAITQGGLLLVVLVLLYVQRQNEQERLARSSERIDTLMSIVEKSSDAHVANALAINRLANAVEDLQRR